MFFDRRDASLFRLLPASLLSLTIQAKTVSGKHSLAICSHSSEQRRLQHSLPLKDEHTKVDQIATSGVDLADL